MSTKHGSTLILKMAVVLIGLPVVVLCYFVLPAIITEWAIEFPEILYMKYPVFAGVIITALAFFFALFQAYTLLTLIDKNKAFSNYSVQALRKIKYSALVIGAVYILGWPMLYYVADLDDAPGLAAIGLIIIFAALVIATFSVILQRLIQTGLEIKSENDLTV